jgi:hypothetical protein
VHIGLRVDFVEDDGLSLVVGQLSIMFSRQVIRGQVHIIDKSAGFG